MTASTVFLCRCATSRALTRSRRSLATRCLRQRMGRASTEKAKRDRPAAGHRHHARGLRSAPCRPQQAEAPMRSFPPCFTVDVEDFYEGMSALGHDVSPPPTRRPGVRELDRLSSTSADHPVRRSAATHAAGDAPDRSRRRGTRSRAPVRITAGFPTSGERSATGRVPAARWSRMSSASRCADSGLLGSTSRWTCEFRDVIANAGFAASRTPRGRAIEPGCGAPDRPALAHPSAEAAINAPCHARSWRRSRAGCGHR